LLGKDWGELEILEHAGYLLFPAEIAKRKADGTFEQINIRLKVPREPEKRKARLEAREISKAEGLDPELDKDLIEDLEVICTVCEATRNNTKPYERWEPYPRALEKSYDRSSIIQLYDKLDAITDAIDPRAKDISEAEMLVLLGAIAKERSILPLLVYGQDAQNSFITTMAALLLNSMAQKSSSDASEPSTPGSSQQSN
jgi:hypothetical protein